MKKFIPNIALLFLILLAGYLMISVIVCQPKSVAVSDYMAAIIDKHQRIREISEPKIILAGGSNLAFGIDSKRLQDEFSVPVVNLGLHAGLGLKFIINELKASVKKEDVVFLSIEYFLGKGRYDLKKYTSTLYPEASAFYNYNVKQEITLHIDKTRENLKAIIKPDDNPSIKTDDNSFSIYTRKAFNQYGDVISHIGRIPPSELKDRKLFHYRYWEGINILNDFYNYAQAKGVNVFFIYPDYPKTEYEQNQLVIGKLHTDIINNLLIEVLNTPQDFIFDDRLFDDTVYHLTGDGRELRTNKLIEIIQKSTNARQAIYKIRNDAASLR